LTKFCGDKYLLQLGTDDPVPVYSTIGCLLDTSITLSKEPVDVTTKASVGNKTLLQGCGVIGYSISATGFFSDNAALKTVQDSAAARVHKNFRLISEDIYFYQGVFEIITIERAGSFNNAETYALTLESAGQILILSNANFWYDDGTGGLVNPWDDGDIWQD